MSKLILPTRVRVHKRASDSKRGSNSKALLSFMDKCLEDKVPLCDSKQNVRVHELQIARELPIVSLLTSWTYAWGTKSSSDNKQESDRTVYRCQNDFCQNSVDRTAGQSTFSDKAKSTLLSIDGTLMSNGNMGITAIFKRHCYLPRERILEDPI